MYPHTPLVEPERLVEVRRRFAIPATRPELHEGTNYHWFWFLEYVQLELAAGGPDPQIKITAEALRAFDDDLAVLLAGAFVNCYTCGGAAAQWSWFNRGLDIEKEWLQVHFGTPGLPIRKERRPVKGVLKFLEAWQSWKDWCVYHWPRVRHADGLTVWDSLEEVVRYSGRYALMKTMETLYRRQLLDACQFDVRPSGAKYPRKTLAKLFPEFTSVLLGKRPEDAVTQRLANVVKEWLEQALERQLSWYEVETVLCTYRQACGQNKYPGRSQDRELMYFRGAEAYWHQLGTNLLEDFSFYTVRNRLFDDVWLGERGGWTAPRRELEDLWIARYPEGVAY